MSLKKTSLLDRLIVKAPHSRLALWCLSAAMRFVVPFNNPHRLSVIEFIPGKAVVRVPFCRSNKNHLGTTHACIMAAAGEYAAGLAIASLISPTHFRIIMRELHVNYLLQGRGPLTANCSIGETAQKLKGAPPTAEQPIDVQTNSELRDNLGQVCATVTVLWQVKPLSQATPADSNNSAHA